MSTSDTYREWSETWPTALMLTPVKTEECVDSWILALYLDCPARN